MSQCSTGAEAALAWVGLAYDAMSESGRRESYLLVCHVAMAVCAKMAGDMTGAPAAADPKDFLTACLMSLDKAGVMNAILGHANAPTTSAPPPAETAP